jgi:hypothetical protein
MRTLRQVLLEMCLPTNNLLALVVDGASIVIDTLVHHWLLHVEVALHVVCVVFVDLSQLVILACVLVALSHFLVVGSVSLVLLVLVYLDLVVQHRLVFAVLDTHFLGVVGGIS